MYLDVLPYTEAIAGR